MEDREKDDVDGGVGRGMLVRGWGAVGGGVSAEKGERKGFDENGLRSLRDFH